MLKICYYDNNIWEGVHPKELVYPFLYELLNWVDTHDASLVIKSKLRRYNKWEWVKMLFQTTHGHIRPPKYSIRIKNAVKALLGKITKIKGHLVGYKEAPPEIKNLMIKLAGERKLILRFKSHDQTWGENADVVITMPDGEVVEGMKNDNIYFFNCHAQRRPPYIKKKVTIFYNPKDIGGILDSEIYYSSKDCHFSVEGHKNAAERIKWENLK